MTLRERMKGVVAGVIVAFMAVLLALFGLQYYAGSGQSDASIAKVNGEAITMQTFDRLLKLQQNAYRGTPGLSEADRLAYDRMLEQQVLGHLLGQTLYQQAISTLPLTVTKEMVQQHLLRESMFLHDDQFSEDLYGQFLAQTFQTSQQYLNHAEWQLKEQQALHGVKQTAFVLPDELALGLSLFYQQRDIGYFLLRPKAFVSEETVDEALIKKYYDDRPHQFVTPERIKLSYVVLDTHDVRKKIFIDSAEVRRAYDQEASAFMQPAQLTYSMIAWPVAADASDAQWQQAEQAVKDFGDEWKLHAQDATWLQALQEQNQRLGVTPSKTVLVEALPDYAQNLALAAVGQVTAPVRIDTGVVVLRLDAKRAVRQQSYAEVAVAIKARMLDQQATEIFSESIEQLVDLVYTHPSDLEVASQALQLDIHTTDWLTRDDAVVKLQQHGVQGNALMVKQAAFGDDVLVAGNNSRVLPIQDGKVMVVRVSARESSQRQPFDASIASSIAQRLRDEHAKAAMRARADELLAALKSGQTAASLAKKYKLTWHTKRKLSMQSAPESQAKGLLAASFSVHGDPNHTPMVTSASMADGAQAVLQVLALHEPKVSDKARKSMEANLQRLFADMDMALYLQPIMAKAKIVINTKN